MFDPQTPPGSPGFAPTAMDGSPWSQLAGNPFFTAGFGLAGLGAAAALARKGIRQAAELLKHRMLVDVEVTVRDESYPWLLRWMSSHQRAQISRNSGLDSRLESLISRITPGIRHLQIQTSSQTRPDGAQQTQFSLVPGQGRHIFRYGRAFIAVNRQREKSFDMMSGVPFETVTLTTLYSQRHVFEDLFQEAHRLAMQMNEGKTVIYTSWGTEWKPFGQPKRKRPFDSVVLERGIGERVLEDVKAFLDARTWYLDRGIPYRRGYLLYGPPGSGKSSFIQALAGELDFNIGILNLSERGLTDDRLNHLLTNIPSRTMILLEDADAAFSNRQQSDEHGYKGATVTFSGLLNTLDGVASAEERIIFLTTNHIERLDEALVRPGRVDLTVGLGHATAWQILHLWDRFYADVDRDHESRSKFLRRMREKNLVGRVSTAALQGLFLVNKGDAKGAIESIDSLQLAHG